MICFCDRLQFVCECVTGVKGQVEGLGKHQHKVWLLGSKV